MMGAGLAVWLLGARPAEAQAGVITARTLLIVDAYGNARGGFTTTPAGGVALMLTDASGAARIGLTIGDDGTPFLTVKDGAGRGSVSLMTMPDGAASLTVSMLGTPRIVLMAHPDGSANALLLGGAPAPHETTEGDGTGT